MTELASAVEFERRLAARRVRMHGYLMISRGELAAERYWPPFGPETNHRMYSVTKALPPWRRDCLWGRGESGFGTRSVNFFRISCPPGGPHPWCAEMTVEDMLTMRTCHGGTTYKNGTAATGWSPSFG